MNSCLLKTKREKRAGGRTNVQQVACETPENPNLLRNDKMVILVQIQNFFKSRMMKRTSPLELSREI